MKREIHEAVQYLSKLILQNCSMGQSQIDSFQSCLIESINHKYQNHWFPDMPIRGQAFRCIRWNAFGIDPLVEAALIKSGLKFKEVGLPAELTIWIDPGEVSCRFGEQQGTVCTIKSFKEETNSKPIIYARKPKRHKIQDVMNCKKRLRKQNQSSKTLNKEKDHLSSQLSGVIQPTHGLDINSLSLYPQFHTLNNYYIKRRFWGISGFEGSFQWMRCTSGVKAY